MFRIGGWFFEIRRGKRECMYNLFVVMPKNPVLPWSLVRFGGYVLLIETKKKLEITMGCERGEIRGGGEE